MAPPWATAASAPSSPSRIMLPRPYRASSQPPPTQSPPPHGLHKRVCAAAEGEEPLPSPPQGRWRGGVGLRCRGGRVEHRRSPSPPGRRAVGSGPVALPRRLPSPTLPLLLGGRDCYGCEGQPLGSRLDLFSLSRVDLHREEIRRRGVTATCTRVCTRSSAISCCDFS
jgi:hypothetical protein